MSKPQLDTKESLEEARSILMEIEDTLHKMIKSSGNPHELKDLLSDINRQIHLAIKNLNSMNR